VDKRQKTSLQVESLRGPCANWEAPRPSGGKGGGRLRPTTLEKVSPGYNN